jgi:diguanylate cyclase (GGDEF)-like protein/PAS domain S-box-containing protein
MYDTTVGAADVAQMARVAAALPDAVVVVDANGTVCWANTAAEHLVGRPLDECIGMNGLDLVHPDDAAMAALSMVSVQDKAVGSAIEVRLAGARGWTLVEVIGGVLDDGHVVLTMRDLSERRRWEVAGDETALFRSLVHNAASLMIFTDATGAVRSVSGALTRQLGHDPERLLGRPLSELVVRDDHDALRVALAEAVNMTGAHPRTIEVSLRGADGRRIPYELSIVSLVDDPTVEGFVVSGHDITRLRAAQEVLEQLASYDSLTGLANRRTFDGALDREWRLTSRDGIDSCVVVADLDGFKRLNDTHGHAAGDEALRRFSHLLRNAARDTDVVARLGGDEFGVILVRCGGEAAAFGLKARLQEDMRRHEWPGGSHLTVSVGHKSLRRALSPEAALHAADVKMLSSKPSR